MPAPSPTVIFNVRVVAGPDVHHELAALVGPTRAQPGCLRCVLLRDAEDSAAVELVEEWASRAELDAHFATEDCRRLLAAIDRARSSPDVRVHTLAASQGMEAIAAARGSGPA